MANYNIALRTPNPDHQKKLRLAVMGVASQIAEKSGTYTTELKDSGNQRKLEQGMAEFSGSIAPIVIRCDGQEVDLEGILAIMLGGGAPASGPKGSPSAATGTVVVGVSGGHDLLAELEMEPLAEDGNTDPDVTPSPDPVSPIPPMSPSLNVFTSAPAVEIAVAPVRQMVVPAPPPPPIVSSGPATPPVTSATGSTSTPPAVELAQHMAVLQEILAAKPATVRMLRFLSQPAIPPFQLDDYSLIRRVMNNKGTKMDIREAGAQRVRIHIRGRGYQINTDRTMPPEYRFVLIQTLANGEIVRIAEGSDPKAVAWAIVVFEQGITHEAGWEARLGRIHGASINRVPPGTSREP